MGKLIRAVLRGQDDGNIIPLPDHHSDELVIPSNIRLITQPPYSPEVKPGGTHLGRSAGKILWEPSLPLA